MNTYREANKFNLVVGVTLILFGVIGMGILTSNKTFEANLFWQICFILFFVLIGGYEIGKYSEMHHEQRKY